MEALAFTAREIVVLRKLRFSAGPRRGSLGLVAQALKRKFFVDLCSRAVKARASTVQQPIRDTATKELL